MGQSNAERYTLAKELYLKGLPIADVARELRITPQILYQRKYREKWDTLPREVVADKAVVIQDVAKRMTATTVEIAEQILEQLRKLPFKDLKSCKEAASALAAAYATARKALGLDDQAAGSRMNVTIYSEMPVQVQVGTMPSSTEKVIDCATTSLPATTTVDNQGVA